MNMLENSVSQIGFGPGSCGTSTVCSSIVIVCGSTRSTPLTISYGTALKPYVNSAPSWLAPAPWSRTKTRTFRPMIASVT